MKACEVLHGCELLLSELAILITLHRISKLHIDLRAKSINEEHSLECDSMSRVCGLVTEKGLGSYHCDNVEHVYATLRLYPCDLRDTSFCSSADNCQF